MNLDLMVDNLIQSANWRELAKHSFHRSHAEGVTYVNLFRDERLTVKLYTFCDTEMNPQGYLVHPHNHSYNFYHKTLIGAVTNWRSRVIDAECSTTGRWGVWQFDTPLRGGKGLSPVDLTVGMTALREDLPAGEGYYLDHKEIHTITPRGDFAAAALVQFHDVHLRPTTMFVPHGEAPECEAGLYEPMHHDEASAIVDDFLKEWRKT